MTENAAIGASISWIARTLRTRFDGRARSLGLTRTQWRMIATIKYYEGCTQSEASSQLEINSVTAGGIIDRLEAAGWVERRPDPVDRRLKRLYLRPAASPMLEKLGEIGADEERVTLEGLSAEDRIALSRLLALLVANLQNTPAPSEVALHD